MEYKELEKTVLDLKQEVSFLQDEIKKVSEFGGYSGVKQVSAKLQAPSLLLDRKGGNPNGILGELAVVMVAGTPKLKICTNAGSQTWAVVGSQS